MKRKGFTPIEFLVVLFILVLLIALLIPAINAARNAVQENQPAQVATQEEAEASEYYKVGVISERGHRSIHVYEYCHEEQSYLIFATYEGVEVIPIGPKQGDPSIIGGAVPVEPPTSVMP